MLVLLRDNARVTSIDATGPRPMHTAPCSAAGGAVSQMLQRAMLRTVGDTGTQGGCFERGRACTSDGRMLRARFVEAIPAEALSRVTTSVG